MRGLKSLARIAVTVCLLVAAVPAAAQSRSHHHARERGAVALRAPRAATRRPQGVTVETATISGVVRRARRPTTWWFQFGTTRRYGAHTPPRRAAAGRRRVTAVLAGLRPASTYHVRLVASTCGGCRASTAYGADVVFATPGYLNPVWGGGEAADPSVLDNNDAHDDYWAYTTGDGFPILRSSDLVHWRSSGAAFPGRPAWAQSGDWDPWAPNVSMANEPCPGTVSPHCYVMYYVGRSAQFTVNCVAVATATAPGGPFIDQGPLSGPAPDALGRPIGCGDDSGFGVIDPSLFIDPATGAPYLYVSVSYTCPAGGTSCGAQMGTLAPTISVIPLSANLLSAAGPRTPLFTGQPGGWEAAGLAAPTVEAPAALVHNGTYYLLFSGGSWRQAYGMGYATAPSPTGPFNQAPSPILSSTRAVGGAGGGDVPVVGPHGGLWLVFHGRAGAGDGPRTLRIDPFSWSADPGGGPDVPVISGPTSTPQAVLP